ncbi:hypothetical protein BU25DRAFT_336012 [Macroventuria anomochaeta]|uniref:Uncharacterized protein n=1 Tax=Macroventuria anomochaeta TaxID=301207 RepID=A0ACB6SA49_9PLEO|nr:uncharacterized protein BU25DRAFT_336012 [Macroventuria anomochaeta]KAF2630099.1 hypothetical protein BU25DRAFT_336012 [Macroventuria anomochaeta]
MSSGNPFRASLAPNQAPSSPVPQTSFITPKTSRPEAGTQHDDVPAHTVSPPSRTKKHVRIESTAISIPPQPDISSPDDSPHTSFAPQQAPAQHAGSPPPASSAAYSNSSPGAYTREPGRSYGVAAPDSIAISNTASGMSYSAISPSVVPANPFAKTLASMEPQRAGGEDRASAEGAAQGNNRASLDVESFKNMLMTGKPYPRQTTQASQPPTAPSTASAAIVESGSSTDASSTSRQSLLEPAHEASVESPRTSYEMARSDEDEVAGLTPERTRSKRKPPPAPAHRHGKLVSPRQPQTVPFDSFAATEAAPSPVTRPRNTSDTNKPLPPAPVVSPPPHIDNPEKTRNNTSPMTEKLDESLSRSNSLQQKRAPPPVPLARRQSQLRHSSTEIRSRSSSSLTLSSQHSLEVPASGVIPTSGEVASNATTTASLKSPPPPPPSRHGARLSDIGLSSADSSSTELPQRSTSVRTTGSSKGPSSRRSTLEGEFELPISRAASIASKRNSHIASSESTGGGMPPPPPPPRRRPGSGRSSLDQQRPFIPSSSPTESRRTSTEHRRTSADLRRTSLDNNRRTSGASEHSLRQDYAPTEEKTGNEYALYSPREEAEDMLAGAGTVEGRKDSNNILDDMEKFQREIDELRSRYKQAG